MPCAAEEEKLCKGASSAGISNKDLITCMLVVPLDKAPLEFQHANTPGI